MKGLRDDRRQGSDVGAVPLAPGAPACGAGLVGDTTGAGPQPPQWHDGSQGHCLCHTCRLADAMRAAGVHDDSELYELEALVRQQLLEISAQQGGEGQGQGQGQGQGLPQQVELASAEGQGVPGAEAVQVVEEEHHVEFRRWHQRAQQQLQGQAQQQMQEQQQGQPQDGSDSPARPQQEPVAARAYGAADGVSDAYKAMRREYVAAGADVRGSVMHVIALSGEAAMTAAGQEEQEFG